ncbi:MAG: hypothetical protein ACO2YR_07650, partial [Nitrosopumilaceae archaeon]
VEMINSIINGDGSAAYETLTKIEELSPEYDVILKSLISILHKVSLEKVPGEKLSDDRILFSESHSRYLAVIDKKNIKKVEEILQKNKASYKIVGKFTGNKIQFNHGKNTIVDLSVDKAQKAWINSLGELVTHG